MPRRNDKAPPVVFEKEIPADTLEGREHQLANLAMRRAEEQLRTGTASAQVICYWLKVASRREVLEKEILEKQARLVGAKTDSIEAAGDSTEMAAKALDAFRGYSPSEETIQ